MGVPEPFTAETGDQHKAAKTIDDFFQETITLIKASHKAGPLHLSIESGEIVLPGVVTDNRVTYLIYRDRVVACVMDTRTELNHVHYDFFRNLENLFE